MDDAIEEWRPGSFTKNFSWGAPSNGLKQLHAEINQGFSEGVQSVPRSAFRKRIASSGRPDYIPLNFFLFNAPQLGADFVIYDELCFQAQFFPHSSDFDLLALFAFNFSFVGIWNKAQPGQDRPALWANSYVRERLAADLDWDATRASADDIQSYVSNDPRFKAQTSRKISTNLAYLYKIGKLYKCKTEKIERWWINALFLALDRIVQTRLLQGKTTLANDYAALLTSNGFMQLTGPRSLEKQLAIKHLSKLYAACGGINRFSDDFVKGLTLTNLATIQNYIDVRPGGAIHVSNPNILKTLPMICASLARHAGFDFLDPDELEAFNVDDFVKAKAASAISRLAARGIKPTMTAAELLKLTREK